MQDGTPVFLVRGDPPTGILIRDSNKNGFGQGKLSGFGGKIKVDLVQHRRNSLP